IKGQKFFYKTNGTQFFMKGIAYQQDINSNTTQTENVKYTDPLADASTCKRDIEHLVKLQTNTIRVYAVDPTKNHDDCMNALADAGIYVVADLSQPGESINRDEPQWNTDLYKRYTSVVDSLAKYDNVLGFFAGNEVSNQPNNTMASAFVKAAVRDTKAYIKSKGYREIGVGYATNDDAEIRTNLAAYFDCGNASDAIDFWGYNIYSWCGDSSFTKSGFDVRTKEFEHYRVPVFFAEYGCNTPRPRLFTEVAALYGKQMTGVWSGGIVYMYFEEANEFGLVSIENGEVKPNDDYKNLQKQISKVKPEGVSMNDYNPPANAASKCPNVGKDWAAVADPLPPAANAQACDCMMNTLTCVVSDKLDEEDYGDLFGTVCGYSNGKYCDGINRNVTGGDPYGAYSMCTPKQQLSFALNAYASKVANGCDFQGKAQTKQASSQTPTGCKELLDQAGPQGTGTLTAAPNAGTAPAGNKKSAATGLSVPQFGSGLFGLGLYVGAAVLSGAAVVL
ncbi:uncharacterized protein EI97DRAFT_359814, partial [Westerdykella ornata]